MLIKILAYLPAIIGLAIVGLAVYLNNPKNIRNRVFASFNLVTVLWLLFLFISDTATRPAFALWGLRFALFFGQVVPLSFYYLALVFPTTLKMNRRNQITFGITYILLALLSFTRLNVETVKILDYGVLPVKTGFLYSISDIVTVLMILVAVAVLIYKYRKTKILVEKSQIRLMLIAVSIVVLVNVFTGIILLRIIEVDSAALLFGNISLLVFSAIVSYAIAKHGLFNIRALLLRSLVYILAVVGIGILYSVIVIGVGSTFINIDSVTVRQRILFSTLALFLAITYTPIINFFNKVTTKLFFRDSYSTQTVLDKVSSVIVGSIDPHKIQHGALAALSEALRPQFIQFYFLDDSAKFSKGDIIGQHSSINDVLALSAALKKIGKDTWLYDNSENNPSSTTSFLHSQNISIVSPLVTKDSIVGYLLLGSKRSGNVYTDQDIGMLNIATNELAVALQNAQRFEEIQAFNITLQEKVNEATRELKSTNKKLIALDEAKDEFISMASHQLRTPLTSIKGYLSMILDGDMGKTNKDQTAALKEAFGSSQRMVFLISDFLNVSRIRTGKFVIEPKEVNLPELVGEELNQLKELAESRDITLNYEPPGEFPLVKLDDNKIRQVMMNMVDNAIYYTPVGGKVTIQLYLDAKDVVFKVVDTGIGVPKDEQHKLFSKFFRAGNARVARPDGTGLGLFMAQKIIVAQNGSVIFESEEGKGSTFGFRFPLKTIKL